MMSHLLCKQGLSMWCVARRVKKWSSPQSTYMPQMQTVMTWSWCSCWFASPPRGCWEKLELLWSVSPRLMSSLAWSPISTLVRETGRWSDSFGGKSSPKSTKSLQQELLKNPRVVIGEKTKLVLKQVWWCKTTNCFNVISKLLFELKIKVHQTHEIIIILENIFHCCRYNTIFFPGKIIDKTGTKLSIFICFMTLKKSLTFFHNRA